MPYCVHFERVDFISLDEWKNAVECTQSARMALAPAIARNPRTGAEVMVPLQPGDVEVLLDDGAWVNVFHWNEGVSFNARALNDPIISQTAFALARMLNADIVGEGGEKYSPD